MTNLPSGYLGVDVQSARRCPYVVLGADLAPHTSGWLDSPGEIQEIMARTTDRLGRVAVGIDAPRCPVDRPRTHYWHRGKWRLKRASEKGHGRHCEVVVKAFGIANPQWTPRRAESAAWMQNGFALYEALAEYEPVYEVFPSASYTMLAGAEDALLRISLHGFAEGPKDMLDAYVAAFTVHEFIGGRGDEVGGGADLGRIVLPRPLPEAGPHGVKDWPGAATASRTMR